MNRIVIVCTWVFVTAAHAAAAQPLSFNRDVRPILSDACFRCHGPDDAARAAGLRLDQRDAALKPQESGQTAIVPDHPEESELVRRILSADPEEKMPPADSGKVLTATQVETLKRWVAEGAIYEGQWSFITPQRPELPAITQADWATNPIDRFILAALEQRGWKPSAAADKETLIRRVSLDLIGLPPTPTEVDQFLADTSPEAYEKLVDRLLASPRYGERMALQWLDFARYADSNGFQVDASREQWPWRDWVIDAYNRNLPYDQFTTEQLAGDLLPTPTRDQIVATGFNRNHRLNGEGGLIAEEWRVETVIDRVETTGLTWLGLTFNCCRCHDHKYDPITQKEFYQLFAFFNSIDESGILSPQGNEGTNSPPLITVSTPDQDLESEKLLVAVLAAEAHLASLDKNLPALIAAWEPEFKEQLAIKEVAWLPLSEATVKSLGGATFKKLDDGSWLAGGKNPAHDVYEIVTPIAEGPLTGLLLECFADASLPGQSLGRYPNGNFVLTRFEADVTAPSLDAPLPLRFTKALAAFSQTGWDISMVNDGNPGNGWAVDGPNRREPNKALFVAAPMEVPAGATLTIRLFHEAISRHNIGRFRLSTSRLPSESLGLNEAIVPDAIRLTLGLAPEARTTEQQTALENYFVANVPNPIKSAEESVAASKKVVTDFQASLPNVMVMKEAAAPRDAFRLNRGEYDKPAEKVERGLPASLPPLPAGAPVNRLGLAQWIVSESNPLTARVWVNRAWERFFGLGIVRTSENFGSQSEFPTHPALLDWLAVEFMQPTSLPNLDGVPAQKWDMKALQKLIVMSATYRQSSHVSPVMLEADPENRFLARGPRVRLTAELLRDQALAVSGLLVEKIGGPSVRPYMPDGVWDETSKYGNLRNYMHDKNDGLYRRSMYTIWKRTAAPPNMLLFDAPSREVCTVKRSRTNTPLQALALLNEVTYVEAARQLADRMVRNGGASVESRIRYGFRLALTREPNASELAVLIDGLHSDQARFTADPEAAKKLLGYGDSKTGAELSSTELAAYTLTANVLLNLDEFVTRE